MTARAATITGTVATKRNLAEAAWGSGGDPVQMARGFLQRTQAGKADMDAWVRDARTYAKMFGDLLMGVARVEQIAGKTGFFTLLNAYHKWLLDAIDCYVLASECLGKPVPGIAGLKTDLVTRPEAYVRTGTDAVREALRALPPSRRAHSPLTRRLEAEGEGDGKAKPATATSPLMVTTEQQEQLVRLAIQIQQQNGIGAKDVDDIYKQYFEMNVSMTRKIKDAIVRKVKDLQVMAHEGGIVWNALERVAALMVKLAAEKGDPAQRSETENALLQVTGLGTRTRQIIACVGAAIKCSQAVLPDISGSVMREILSRVQVAMRTARIQIVNGEPVVVARGPGRPRKNPLGAGGPKGPRGAPPGGPYPQGGRASDDKSAYNKFHALFRWYWPGGSRDWKAAGSPVPPEVRQWQPGQPVPWRLTVPGGKGDPSPEMPWKPKEEVPGEEKPRKGKKGKTPPPGGPTIVRPQLITG